MNWWSLYFIYDLVVALNKLHFLTNVLKGFFGKRYLSCVYNFLSAYVDFRNEFLKDKFSFMG
ncbi:hypothetical protein AWE51_12155 [Aquimarina aggregata]|uniref:Uncharacterized protein n=1 Tax=Aquimarina aggregata TaxID=1642818 RepID=A0A162CM56_9FLAO|nr:hypothetical protein AWE51_12155 [Aquimarina aggregata]